MQAIFMSIQSNEPQSPIDWINLEWKMLLDLKWVSRKFTFTFHMRNNSIHLLNQLSYKLFIYGINFMVCETKIHIFVDKNDKPLLKCKRTSTFIVPFSSRRFVPNEIHRWFGFTIGFNANIIISWNIHHSAAIMHPIYFVICGRSVPAAWFGCRGECKFWQLFCLIPALQ